MRSDPVSTTFPEKNTVFSTMSGGTHSCPFESSYICYFSVAEFCISLNLLQAAAQDPHTATSIYDFSATDIDGNVVSLEKYRWGYISHRLLSIVQSCVYYYRDPNLKDQSHTVYANEREGHPMLCESEVQSQKQIGFKTSCVYYQVVIKR